MLRQHANLIFFRDEDQRLAAAPSSSSSATHPLMAVFRELPQPLLPYPTPPTSLANLQFPMLHAWKRQHGQSIKVLYMEDAERRELSHNWVMACTRTICGCWGTLVDLGFGPPTWANRNNMVWDWLRKT
jgi:hypothetical protein